MIKNSSKFIAIIIILFLLIVVTFLDREKNDSRNPDLNSEENLETDETEQLPDVSIILQNLEIPWDIVFISENELLVTERIGQLTYFNQETEERKIINIPSNIRHVGEGGLLGATLHPNFQNNSFVYLYLTKNVDGGLINRIERYVWDGNELRDQKIIIDNLPGAQFHDGGRIAFGPDGFLYVTVGDALVPALAQNRNSLAGKVLRIDEEGGIPNGNPFNSEIYSYGHRNPQGLAWDNAGRLWATEHGPSARDEINLIVKGGNYGWPDSVGDNVLENTIAPVLHAGLSTWAPASLLYWDSSLFFGGLRGQALFEARLDGDKILELKKHYEGEFGRIRTVTLGPDGMFYLTTSNKDGRGFTQSGDDKIIRLNPTQFRR